MPPSRALVAAAALLALPVRAAPVLRPSELASGDYAETFTFVADLDDGGYLQLQLAVTNLGPGSGTGLCRALVKRPGAPAWTSHQRLGRSGWRHLAGDDGELLAIGPCQARSGTGASVRVALGGRAVELTFPEPLSERAPPTVIQVGDREYRASILQAFTPVVARLTGFGADAPLAGGGYADHSVSTVPPAALARRWIRFRALRPPRRLLVLGRQLADGRWDPAWCWREGQAPRPVEALALRRAAGPDGGWTAGWRDGPVAAALASGPALYRHDPLAELGWVGRLVGAVMDVPVTTTYRASLAAPAPVDGILEVSILGEE